MDNSDTYVLSFWVARVWEFVLDALGIVTDFVSHSQERLGSSPQGDHCSTVGVQERDGREANPTGGQPKAATLSA